MRPYRTAAILALALGASTAAANAQTPSTEPTPTAGQSPTPEDTARIEEARSQYRDGVAAFRARRFGDAVVAFERSFRARPHPTTLYNAAESRLRAGDRARAVEQLRDLLAMSSPAPDEQTIERARTLAREAGTENLEPTVQVRGPECPTCPVCPLERQCPVCPPATTVSGGPSPILPVVLMTGGALVMATGIGFYAAALTDSAVYNSNAASDATRMEVRPQGEAFRWIGLVTTIVGLGLEVTGMILAVRPPPATAAATTDRRSRRTPPPATARVDVSPQGLLVTGTF